MRECLQTGEKSLIFDNAQMGFNAIIERTDITYLYMFAVDEQHENMIYYINAFTRAEVEELEYGAEIVDLNFTDPLPSELREMVANPGEKIWNILNQSDYGYVMGAYSPIYDNDGNVVGFLAVDIDMNDVNSTLQTYIITVLIGSFVIMAVCVFLTVLFIQSKITAPIQQLSKSADSFVNQEESDDNRETLQPIISTIKTNDEIETLSDSIEKMTTDMITYIENLTAVTAEKERIGAELNVATQIQADMLPCVFPAFPEYNEFDIYASMQPAKEVGGDFYDFFLIDKNTLAVVMADVSGKGVPAALFMVIAKTLIKNNAQSGKSPKEVFETVNNMLCENNDAGMFVTAFMGYLNIKSGNFVFVNAGHNPPLFKQNGKFDWLETKVGFVLAGMEDMPYTQSEITLSPNDELFLYTDGVTEADNNEKELFGDPRLLEIVNAMDTPPLDEMTVEIKKEIDKFADGAEQADDITMLALRYKG